MKRWKVVFLVFLLGMTAACGSTNHAADMAVPDAVKSTLLLPPDPEPEFELTPLSEERSYTAEDGTVVAECSYQLVTMRVSNADELSPETAAQAETTVKNFNERMDQRLQEAVAFSAELGNIARGAYEDGCLDNAYIDQAGVSAMLQGRIYSIQISSSGYTGGAHPNNYTDCDLFDLELGRFIDPAQVADDPVAFQTGVAELLLEKAEEQPEEIRSCFWPEYADVIGCWYEGAVVFDKDGMSAIFSPYVLGSSALGSVELKVSYDEIKDLLGPGGLERLGLSEENPR